MCGHLCALGVAAVALATLAAAFARDLWPADLAVHFRIQYGAFAALALPCLLWSRRLGIAAVALLVVGINLWIVLPRLPAPAAPAAAADR